MLQKMINNVKLAIIIGSIMAIYSVLSKCTGGQGCDPTVKKAFDKPDMDGTCTLDVAIMLSALPRTNEQAIGRLKPLANGDAKPGTVLILIWHWEKLGVVGKNHSVGHVAVAIKEKGEWKIVLSQFPDPSGRKGVNTTVSDPFELKWHHENGRVPDAAYTVRVKDMRKFADSAISDLNMPLWCFNPARDSTKQTNCTWSAVRALNAGGIPVDFKGVSPANSIGVEASPGKMEESLRDLMVTRPDLDILQRNDLIKKFKWDQH